MKKTPPEPRPLLDVQEVARRLKIKPARVYKLIDAGKLPATNLSATPGRRTLRIDSDDLDYFILRNTVQPPAGTRGPTMAQRRAALRRRKEEAAREEEGNRE